MQKYQGSMVALITPFKNGKIDFEALERLVEFHVKNGTTCIVVTGTTGECPTLSFDEHVEAIKAVVDYAKGRIQVMAGAGSNNPVEAIALSNAAKDAGADCLLHNAGYYNRPNQEGLYAHFKMVHDNTDLPIFLYNVPGRTVVNISSELVAKLAKLERIIGIKDATGNLERPWIERNLIDKPFIWLSGEDSTAVNFNVAGGVGVISVTANVAPALVAKVQNLTLEKKWEEAADEHLKLMTLHKLMFKEPSPAPAKYGASLLGLCSEESRLPILPISQSLREEIKTQMQKLELI
ncbi:MAG: 4-hydroxy-tetrahydrodipicolinate synthase [Succinivibrio dextrinosolvens]|jgi:4-hydroxy-tetrahydrodipicolinate synthase|uniref:4-hydroxy-tetrahydrodipicolinate synthase n=1 Tax=Succinivibrio dextrinosolvens TaxID=83771 RepID=A0A662ZB10_9GAMM|nr:MULTISPECIES: 4-hydroxy-tetrahydrodipicolinate synthase [Succinivibrio]MBQ3884443.1 4-hydroxy-tetrahydrodipicolinate synthase [Succinivibrio sp.]MBQ9220168.1 4-hydroxy-tetrahydrodipicolinate synthase [Succinivibrio sp.]MDY6415690.1 4-hydroxy-tetrahydrodipicolinate synthase [Succinivibrio dextrinosolvens]MDY6420444.1 4-hydroxy-tetrahydrodipicolinate synthase [Succinivibrio dextrinosolvens]MDY6470503.1 4-hydroxy-tetrahydrodipicolinate synthase [Succinivibrio dextrinosolvens]